MMRFCASRSVLRRRLSELPEETPDRGYLSIVVGQRGESSWPNGRGIRGEIPLIDGGYITCPEFALYSPDRKWLIENRGVAPDIEIDPA